MDYIEFLKENGAGEDELKVLGESRAARSAFDKMNARAEAAERERQQAIDAAKKSSDQVAAYDQWFQEKAVPERQEIENQLVTANAELAKAKAALKTAQDRGLIDTTQLGYNLDDAAEKARVAAATAQAAGLDPRQYFNRDEILQIADKEGEAIAVAQDIAYEHSRLFPDKPLNFRQLRQEAKERRVPLEQLWQDKFGVQAAREAREKAAHDAEVAKWKAEGAKEKETELVSRYGNPDTRPLAPSSSPFTKRPAGSGRDKQPWEAGDRSDQRVMEATKKVVAQLTQ
jgi:hypothetical protein